MPTTNWPVYNGGSFNIWNPDTGEYYASAVQETITEHLFQKRKSSSSKKTSVHHGFSINHISERSTLHCYSPRIAIRDITNSVDSRTIYAALIPPDVVATNKAPVMVWRENTTSIAQSEAFLLGILSSMILDWYARRIVDLTLNFVHINGLPIPWSSLDNSDTTALRVVHISGQLAAVDARFDKWAKEVGVPVDSVNDPKVKQSLIYELDACVAHLYNLDEEDIICLYETFHARRAEHTGRKEAVLRYFKEKPWL